MATVPEALQVARQHVRGHRFREASRVCRRIMEVVPEHLENKCLLEVSALNLRDFDTAISYLESAANQLPRNAQLQSCLGSAYIETNRADDGLHHLKLALDLQPGSPHVLQNIGNAYRSLGQFDESLKYFRQSLDLAPNDGTLHSQCALGLVFLGRFDEAIASYERSLQLAPEFATGHKNFGLLRMLLGDLSEGWKHYDWRFAADNKLPLKRFEQPLWDGSGLNGETVLLYGEQGFGDTVQFIRFAKTVKEHGGKCVVMAHSELRRLLSDVEGVEGYFSSREELIPFDLHAPLMSVPGILGTTVDTIPSEKAYLRAEEELVASWRDKLAEYPRPLVGLCWQGSPKKIRDNLRSIPLKDFAPIAETEVQLVSLQKGQGTSEQIAECGFGGRILNFEQELQDFADTASLIENLDVVVTCDTVIAHLAGALGKPTWVLIQRIPDWRWLLDREDSPWYPSVRLFRQEQWGDWASVIGRIRRGLIDMQPAN